MNLLAVSLLISALPIPPGKAYTEIQYNAVSIACFEAAQPSGKSGAAEEERHDLLLIRSDPSGANGASPQANLADRENERIHTTFFDGQVLQIRLPYGTCRTLQTELK